MTKEQIFKEHLETNERYCDYNGEHYTLLDKYNKVVIFTKTSDEMTNYMLGYGDAIQEANIVIEDLREGNEELIKQNLTNIERYEKIIGDMSGETIEQETSVD